MPSYEVRLHEKMERLRAKTVEAENKMEKAAEVIDKMTVPFVTGSIVDMPMRIKPEVAKDVVVAMRAASKLIRDYRRLSGDQIELTLEMAQVANKLHKIAQGSYWWAIVGKLAVLYAALNLLIKAFPG